MAQYITDVTALSSKGQVVLPKLIRDSMRIGPGARLIVISDGSSIILKPVPMPDISEFQHLMDAASAWAKEVGMTEEDISSAIKTVRGRRKARA
ncbi:MAG: AbrB/MazE/SpoVT family DNA-binding domain-containing protein [Acidaminococcaceae bacterium]|nr:AbrB/MazE/SpoVT family DNA-binding domain-containing protein [Acidaminococcaceae bacterium]